MPLHTRLIRIDISPAGDERLRVDGRIVDVRKRGIVTFGGRPRGPGVVHDMSAGMEVDARTLRVLAVDPGMHIYPFHATAETGGESCADRIAGVGSLVGLSLENGYGDALTERIGGPLGCFHIFTLLRLIGPTVCHARATNGLRTFFSRTVIADALTADDNRIALHGSLCDLGTSAPGETRLGSAFECTARIVLALPRLEIIEAVGRMRESRGEEAGPWSDEPSLAALRGLDLRKGFSGQAQQVLGDPEGQRPLTHLVFMLAPVAVQAMPAFLAEIGWRPPPGSHPGGALDSCHMWRREGPLHRLLARNAAGGGESAR